MKLAYCPAVRWQREKELGRKEERNGMSDDDIAFEPVSCRLTTEVHSRQGV